MQEVFARLGLRVFQRDWLSSNNILFERGESAPATLVDTGYATHAAQTVALVAHALGDQPLGRIVNTHLHSDHCGGNAALHARWGCRILVPAPSWEAVRRWDRQRLTFDATGQRCAPFPADEALVPGSCITLGDFDWQVHAVGGHDPDAVVLFEPTFRVLISGDALWRDRVAIIFPELAGEDGFGPALASLRMIEALDPACAIPGHGAPFADVHDALRCSRARIERFQAEPARHLHHARRALIMFHMLEHRQRDRNDLAHWAATTALLAREDDPTWPEAVIDGLVRDGILSADGTHVFVRSA